MGFKFLIQEPVDQDCSDNGLTDQTMTIEGMPRQFWVVLRPTKESYLADICVACNFKQFASLAHREQNEDRIVGIYADEQAARTAGLKLMEAVIDEPPDLDTVIHQSPWKAWIAVQEDCFIRIYDEVSGERIKINPPADWKTKWSWNITDDRTGIMMQKLQ